MSDRTCNACNKRLIGNQTKFCSHLCANRTNTRARSARIQTQPWAGCQVPGCQNPARSRIATMCPKHYHRMYRYGTLDKLTDLRREGLIPRNRDDITGLRFGTLTVKRPTDTGWDCLCDCGNRTEKRTGDLKRTLDASTCGTKANHLAPTVEYSGAHSRHRSSLGRARDHRCTDCQAPASHWSYNHDDPDELISTATRTHGIAYSLKAEHYSPRCVPCHKRFDLDRLDGTRLVG